MDFVVVGLGLGGLGILLGLLTRDVGSRRWRLRPDAEPGDEASRRVAAARACRAGGRVLALGGAGAGLATLAALLLRLGDRAGALLLLASLLAAAASAILWAATYAHRYHPRPVGRRPPRPGVPATAPAGRDGDEPTGGPDTSPVPLTVDAVSARTDVVPSLAAVSAAEWTSSSDQPDAGVPNATPDDQPTPSTAASAPASPDDDRSPSSDAGAAAPAEADPAGVPVAETTDADGEEVGDPAQSVVERSSPSPTSSRPLTPAANRS